MQKNASGVKKGISNIFRNNMNPIQTRTFSVMKNAPAENLSRFAAGFCRQKRSAAKHLKISTCIYSKKYV